jgi:hypothetical protein
LLESNKPQNNRPFLFSQTMLTEEMGCVMTERSWPDRWFFPGGALTAAGAAADADVAAVDAHFAALATADPSSTDDTPADAWLRARGATDRQLAIAEACYANDFGAGLADLGLTELAAEARAWDSGDSYLVPDRPFSALVTHMASFVPAGRVRTSWPVESVVWGCDGVALAGPAGRVRARRAILTVPLALLQRGDITFDPPLPPPKAGALARLRVGAATKVVVALRRAIWPPGFFDAVCPGAFVPEWWVKDGCVQGDRSGATAITGFLCGRFAAAAAALGRERTVASALAQLDAMFGSESDPRPATDAFVGAHVIEWDKERWAGGGYSHPSLGALPTDRAALAAPEGGTLFFAGEATHSGVNPCLQAAVETGERAAAQVVAAAGGDDGVGA